MRPLRAGTNSLEDGGFLALFHRRFSTQLAYLERKKPMSSSFQIHSSTPAKKLTLTRP